MSIGKNKEDEDNVTLDNVTLSCSPTVSLLGIIIHNKTNFHSFIKQLKTTCKKKCSQKLNALGRLANVICFPQKKLLFNSFRKYQIN